MTLSPFFHLGARRKKERANENCWLEPYTRQRGGKKYFGRDWGDSYEHAAAAAAAVAAGGQPV
jgi:hypothetical protein